MINELGHLSHEERLERLTRTVQPREEKAWGTPMDLNTWWEGEKKRARLFSVVHRDRVRGNGNKLKYKTFLLNIKRSFFMVRVVEHGNRMCREVAESPSLEILKIWPDRVLGKLLQPTPPWARGWTRQSQEVPANLSSSDLWNTFWKCLKDKVLENLPLQNSLSNIIQNHCLLGYAGHKQARTNKCFYQDLKIAVTLKTQTSCNLPAA